MFGGNRVARLAGGLRVCDLREWTEPGSGRLRTDLKIGPLPAPARLAPFSHAVSATVYPAGAEEETAPGRLVLLFDPDGVPAWRGNVRTVVFAARKLDTEIAQDPLLPEAAWSWLTESRNERRRPQQARRDDHGHLLDPLRRHRRAGAGPTTWSA